MFSYISRSLRCGRDPLFPDPAWRGPDLTLAAFFLSGASADAQTKGQLSHVRDQGAAFLILNGRNDNRAARLSVDGGENLGGFLELHRDGLRRVYAYVDSDSEGGLTLSFPTGEAVKLFIDNSSNSGVLVLKNTNEDTRAFLRVTDAGRGKLSLDGSDNVEKVDLYVDGVNQGGVRIRGTSGADAGVMFVGDSTDSGILRLMRDGGGTRAEISVDGNGRGRVVLDGAGGGQRVRPFVDGNDRGSLNLRDSGGERAALGIDDSLGGGVMSLRDASGNVTVTLDGSTGVIAKSGVDVFLIDHPDNPSQQIFYAAVEGAEADMYIRGSGQLSGGVAKVELPDHFEAVAREETVTVQVTPTSRDTRGLVVTENTTGGFVVEELGPQFGDNTFDWPVMAERGDIEPIQVVRSPFALRIDKLDSKTIALDATTMPAGVMPIIEPKADRPVLLNPKRFRMIRQGKLINADILPKPDVEQGILVNPERLREPDLRNPERVQPGLTAPTRPGPLLRREPGKPRRDDQ